MSILEEIKSKIEKTDPEDVRLYFITRKKINEDIEYNVLKTEINKEIGKTLLDIGKNKIDSFLKLKDLRIIDYSTLVNLEQNNIQTIDKDDVNYLNTILQDINRADLDIFDMKRSKNLWAYAIKIGDTKTILFRKYTENRILDRKGWIALFISEGKFNQLRGPVLTIDDDIDTIFYYDKLYILNVEQFERTFSFMDKFIGEINDSLKVLEEKDLVDVSFMWNLCKTDPRKIKKLYKILKGDGVKSLNLETIKKLDTEYNLGLIGKDGKKIIVNSNNIWTVLKVLDDDYLKSPVTDNKYEVYSKVKKT
ncbi:MAG: DUF4868 domain-containing protein [Candidatus Micrarchaeaceae archaeon]